MRLRRAGAYVAIGAVTVGGVIALGTTLRPEHRIPPPPAGGGSNTANTWVTP